ncbi:RNA-directed DNA polymerase, eukaryota [Tanacetum coccineum]
MIHGIMKEDVWISDPSQIKEEFLKFFNENLVTPVSLDEVKNAVWDCDSSKAPGPDGFSFAFVNKYWDYFEVDILEYVNIFLDTGSLPHGSNSSFFTLIPKVSNPIFIKDFRPISLISVHYKIIAKILANRLAKVIDKIVSHEESTFIAGSQILDALILNEIVECSKWRSWIRACLSSSRALVLINGSRTSEFSIKCGLRQGDPLLPFLFILVMEGLHNALSTAVSSGLIRSVKLGSPEVTISHLFYADDVIITTEWNDNDLDNIIRVLQVFYLASGLKINILKSNIYGIGVSDVDVSSMDNNSGCASGGVGGCYRTRTRSGLTLSKLYRVRKNWSRPNLGAQNSADLLDMLVEISYTETNEVEDTFVWSLGTDGSFSIKDARFTIDSKILPSLAPSTVWDKNIPQKVNLFIWRLILDRLPHKLNLSSYGIDIQAISCFSCNGNVESLNHMFTECNIAKDIWMLVRKWCDILMRSS